MHILVFECRVALLFECSWTVQAYSSSWSTWVTQSSFLCQGNIVRMVEYPACNQITQRCWFNRSTNRPGRSCSVLTVMKSSSEWICHEAMHVLSQPTWNRSSFDYWLFATSNSVLNQTPLYIINVLHPVLQSDNRTNPMATIVDC